MSPQNTEEESMAPESKSVSRGVLWLIIAMCASLIMALGTVASSGAAAWARTVEDRGIQNERRISTLEAKFSAMDAKLDSSADRQREVLVLLRQHIEDETKVVHRGKGEE
jgi:hypothetical protein